MRTARLLLAALVVSACASGAAQQTPLNRGERNVLTNAQLVATNSQSLYEAVEKLRPEWLTSRGPTSVTDATPTAASVFMNGQNLGKADYLKEVRVLDISEVRFWPAGQASARFGMGHPRGVIEITRQ